MLKKRQASDGKPDAQKVAKTQGSEILKVGLSFIFTVEPRPWIFFAGKLQFSKSGNFLIDIAKQRKTFSCEL